MPDRKPFLLRVDRAVLDALQAWANDELRSLNGQIEYVLRRSLIETGRLKKTDSAVDREGKAEGGSDGP